VESVVVREFFLNVGRVISIYCLIYFGSELEGGWIPWILITASLTQIALVWSVRSQSECQALSSSNKKTTMIEESPR
jgi:YQGE family putative transporter